MILMYMIMTMENEPTPIGRGEQIDLEKKTEELERQVDLLKETAVKVIEIRNRIKQEYEGEMAKPEWARRGPVIDRLKKEFDETEKQIDKLTEISGGLQSVLEYIRRRDQELEERKKEQGY